LELAKFFPAIALRASLVRFCADGLLVASRCEIALEGLRAGAAGVDLPEEPCGITMLPF
jgi:hypothetical protein